MHKRKVLNKMEKEKSNLIKRIAKEACKDIVMLLIGGALFYNPVKGFLTRESNISGITKCYSIKELGHDHYSIRIDLLNLEDRSSFDSYTKYLEEKFEKINEDWNNVLHNELRFDTALAKSDSAPGYKTCGVNALVFEIYTPNKGDPERIASAISEDMKNKAAEELDKRMGRK